MQHGSSRYPGRGSQFSGPWQGEHQHRSRRKNRDDGKPDVLEPENRVLEESGRGLTGRSDGRRKRPPRFEMATSRHSAFRRDGPGVLHACICCKDDAQTGICRWLKHMAQETGGRDPRERLRQGEPGQGSAIGNSDRQSQVEGQTPCREREAGVEWTPRPVHGCYILATSASANSLVRSRVAPSINRWKS